MSNALDQGERGGTSDNNFPDRDRVTGMKILLCTALVAMAAPFAAIAVAPTPAPVAPSASATQAAQAETKPMPVAQAVAALKSGGYIVYFRHASTDFSQARRGAGRGRGHDKSLRARRGVIRRIGRTRHPHLATSP